MTTRTLESVQTIADGSGRERRDLSGSLSSIATALVHAGRSNIDFVAFAFSAVVGAFVLVATGRVMLFPVVVGSLAVVWIATRYALFRLQSAERLRALRETSQTQAQIVLQKRVSKADAEIIFGKDDTDV